MQHSLNIPPHLKRVATLPCEIIMSENSLLISEIHLIISLHFAFVKKNNAQRPKNDSTLCQSHFLFLTLNILWFSLSTCYDGSVVHYAPHRTEHASFLT